MARARLQLTSPDAPRPPTPAILLRAARELLADPDRWTQGTCARNADGKTTLPWDCDAITFDLYGALVHVAYMRDPKTVHGPAFQQAAHLLRGAALALTRQSWGRVNDRIGHVAVLAVLDQAAAWADQQTVRGVT